MDEKRNLFILLVDKPQGKIPLGRPRRRCVDSIKIDVGEMGWGSVDWIGLVHNKNKWRPLLNALMKLRVP
jgi:hypothetical protein